MPVKVKQTKSAKRKHVEEVCRFKEESGSALQVLQITQLPEAGILWDKGEHIDIRGEFFVELFLSGTRVFDKTVSPVGLDILSGRL